MSNLQDKYMNRLKTTAVLIFLIMAVSVSCGDVDHYRIATPIFPLAEESRIDHIRLADAYWEARINGSLKSLIVERSGTVVAEEYFFYENPDSAHHVWSVTKSFTSALIGIAIENGYIDSENQKIAEYIAPLTDSLPQQIGSITIEQLLTMSTGLEWHEIGETTDFPDWMDSDDKLTYILEKPFTSEPGELFNYSDGAAHLMSIVLTEATGMKALDFANEYLFGPMGIDNIHWEKDNRGYNYGGWGLIISPRDMLKFGRMYMDGGMYDGQQVVPEDWATWSTSPRITTNDVIPYGPDYGYYWWCGEEHDYYLYYAMGYSGQFIVNIPELDVVVVATSKTASYREEAGAQWDFVINLIINRIIPAIQK